MINYLCFPTRGKACKDTNKTIIPNTLIDYYYLKFYLAVRKNDKKLKNFVEKFAG